jgi:cobalt-precorrin 5A hydrolase
VVVDENGDYSISLLSGHLGGGNDLAKQTADILGGAAVITTGSDVSGQTSIDLWSVENNLSIANPGILASVATSLLNTGSVRFFQDREYVIETPGDFVTVEHIRDADIVVSLSEQPAAEKLLLIPRTRFIGCGCRKGTSLEDLQRALADLEKNCGIDLRSIAGIASIDLKKSEAGLLGLARENDWPSLFYTKDELNGIVTPSRSEQVYDKVGVYNVCEAAALKAAGGDGPGRLIVRKIKWKNITMAVAEAAA